MKSNIELKLLAALTNIIEHQSWAHATTLASSRHICQTKIVSTVKLFTDENVPKLLFDYKVQTFFVL